MSDARSGFNLKILTKRHFGSTILVTGLLVFGAFLINGSFGEFLASPTSANDDRLPALVRPLPVNVAKISMVDSIQQTRTYTGTIRARHRSDLGFEIPGEIETISVDEGDVVTQGQELAELDTESLKAQLEATLARIDQAKSLLKDLEAGPRHETKEAARHTMAAAQSLYDNAVLNLERRNRLRDANAISNRAVPGAVGIPATDVSKRLSKSRQSAFCKLIG